MPRLFASASSQFLERASTPITATPLTMCFWWNPTTSASFQIGMSVGNSGTANNWFAVGVTSSAKPYAETNNTTATSATHATSVTNGQWGHVCGVFASATSRTIYFNGIGPVTDATSKTPTGLNVMSIGRINSGGTGSANANAIIGHAAAWNAALTADEVLLLAKGETPLRIRSTSLQAYGPIWNLSPETDMMANTGFTVTGATNSTNLPPMSQYNNNYQSFRAGDGGSVSEKIR